MKSAVRVLPVPETTLNQILDRGHDDQRSGRGGDQLRSPGEDAENGLREQRDEEQERGDDDEGEHGDAPPEFHDFIGAVRADQVADQRACRRGKGVREDENESRDVADEVDHGERTLSEMFDRDEKEEPDADRNERLEHGPHRKIQHAPQNGEIEGEYLFEPVFVQVDPAARVNAVEKHGKKLRRA